MEHKIKMIGFDLDGTLLTTEKELTKRTKEALDEAMRRGIIILPVTGRPLSGVPEVLREYEGIHYMITSNGARIAKDAETIYESLLPKEKARQILDIFEEYDTLREIYYDGTGYAQRDSLAQIERYMPTPAMAKYISNTRIPVDNTREKFNSENRDLDKIQALFCIPGEKEEAWKRIEALGGVEVTGALATNIEVNAGGVHKGVALLWLAEKFGIKREEIMAFGDGSNDLRMIQTAGVGVAMENGLESIKAAADIIAPSNDEDGVAAVIEKYVLSQ